MDTPLLMVFRNVSIINGRRMLPMRQPVEGISPEGVQQRLPRVIDKLTFYS
jgi:hypothetical protein